MRAKRQNELYYFYYKVLRNILPRKHNETRWFGRYMFLHYYMACWNIRQSLKKKNIEWQGVVCALNSESNDLGSGRDPAGALRCVLG